MTKLTRNLHIAEKIVFVDGFSGTGKSILGPVLGSLKDVEKQRIEHIFEYLCILDKLGKIERDAAISLMRIYADLGLFNSMISREVNMRLWDDSGLLNNPDSLKYVARLLLKDGDAVLKRTKDQCPILQIMSHQIFPGLELAFSAYDNRLRVIEMVRHPLFLIDHWFSYIERYGKDSREFSLWIDFGGKTLPWFSCGWEEEFVEMKTMDKVVHSIRWLQERTDEVYHGLKEPQTHQIMFVPFEKFVTDPWPLIEQLETFVGSKRTRATGTALRKQKCPREHLMAGRGHKHYGWSKADSKKDDFEWVKEKRRFVENNASTETVKIFDELCEDYERTYKVTITGAIAQK